MESDKLTGWMMDDSCKFAVVFGGTWFFSFDQVPNFNTKSSNSKLYSNFKKVPRKRFYVDIHFSQLSKLRFFESNDIIEDEGL